MTDIIKFPATAYEKLVARANHRKSPDLDVEIYRGNCAASVWLDTVHARAIAHRVATWIMHNAKLNPNGLSATFPPGWHYQMIHGKPPNGTEEALFWAEMQGERGEFRIGFTRGLLHMVAMALRMDREAPI
jgi:hypothetical protein